MKKRSRDPFLFHAYRIHFLYLNFHISFLFTCFASFLGNAMKIIKSISEIQVILDEFRKENKTIGFIPTMGALHKGHISLVKQSTGENKISVVSIFVNPTQFNDKNDLLKYPHTEEMDCNLLEKAECDIVFLPTVEEMYPEKDTRLFDFGSLEQVMEGRFRPGQFNGVAQIVSKLFNIIKPDRAYFGEKDFQQLAIVREMVKQLNIPVEIIACPIVREKNGLAMSSRNMRLSPEQKESASVIFRTLSESKKLTTEISVEELKTWVTEKINFGKKLDVEYFEIVNGCNLQSVSTWEDARYIVGCIAVFCGEVRLIDNITYQVN
jgi:pantoate--beta-alanine ligase